MLKWPQSGHGRVAAPPISLVSRRVSARVTPFEIGLEQRISAMAITSTQMPLYYLLALVAGCKTPGGTCAGLLSCQYLARSFASETRLGWPSQPLRTGLTWCAHAPSLNGKLPRSPSLSAQTSSTSLHRVGTALLWGASMPAHGTAFNLLHLCLICSCRLVVAALVP